MEMVRRAGWKPFAIAAVTLIALASPFWAPPLLAHLSFFRVRTVEVQGVRYLAPSAVLARLEVDTTMSVWDDVRPLERRIATLPQVSAVTIDRKLPGTLVIHVTEDLPVAFVPSRSGLQAVDSAGRVLPIDASRVDVDLPVIAARDTALLRLLTEVRGSLPSVYDRLSDARRVEGGELVLTLPEAVVRAEAGVTVSRLADIIPVERDLARRGAHVAELDLRFRDQVIARLQ
jgi:cell division septal protein FtsQ